MKKLLAVLILSTALAGCIPGFEGILSKANAADKVCSIATEQEFYQNIAPLKAKIYSANQKALELFLKAANDSRAKAGLFLFQADKMIIGIFKEGDTTKVGIAMFKDGCLVPGMTTSMTIEAFESLTELLGVVFEDFSNQVDA